MARRLCDRPDCNHPHDSHGLCRVHARKWTRSGRPSPAADGPAPTCGPWVQHAACRPGTGVDPELFWPISEDGATSRAQVLEAKSVCHGCPVRVECIEWAVTELPYGIAGGHTAGERSELRRHQAVAAPAEVSA